jgi:hypothetical protein
MVELQTSHAAQQLTAALAEVSHPKDFRRLSAAAPGDGWRSFAELIADAAAMDGFVDTATARYQGRDEVAGALISLRLAGPIIDLAVSLLVSRGWAIPLPADGVMLSVDENGFVTAVAPRDPVIVTARAEDGEAGADALYAYLAGQLNAILQPAFGVLKARTRYGLRGMWGQATDQIAGIAARRSRLLGQDQAQAWRSATRLTDALAAVQPLIRMRPSAFESRWPAGPAVIAVKGTCCLYFKVAGQRDQQRYCSNCPVLPDESRGPRIAEQLRREYGRLYDVEQAVA